MVLTQGMSLRGGPGAACIADKDGAFEPESSETLGRCSCAPPTDVGEAGVNGFPSST